MPPDKVAAGKLKVRGVFLSSILGNVATLFQVSIGRNLESAVMKWSGKVARVCTMERH